MGPRATLSKEPRRCSRDRLWTAGAGSRKVYRPGSQSPCQDAQGPGLLRFAPSSRKQAALDGFFLSRLFFQFLHTDGLYGSHYRRLIFWYYYVRRNKLGIFFYWYNSTGPHITSSHATGCTAISRSYCDDAALTRH